MLHLCSQRLKLAAWNPRVSAFADTTFLENILLNSQICFASAGQSSWLHNVGKLLIGHNYCCISSSSFTENWESGILAEVKSLFVSKRTSTMTRCVCTCRRHQRICVVDPATAAHLLLYQSDQVAACDIYWINKNCMHACMGQLAPCMLATTCRIKTIRWSWSLKNSLSSLEVW